jgi:hypothetical protein
VNRCSVRHGQLSAVEVNVLPAKRQDLALAQARTDRRCQQRVKLRATDALEERPHLVSGEGMQLAACLRGRIDESRHVADHLALPLRVGKRRSQRVVGRADGRDR